MANSFSEIKNACLITIVRMVVCLYTQATLPIYYIVNRLWNALQKERLMRALLTDPQNLFSTFKSIGKVPPIDSVINEETIDSLVEKAVETQGENYIICGVRVVNDKRASYEWISYGDVLKRVSCIAKGLRLIGVSKGDLVMIFAETRLEWILCAFAVFKLGASIMTISAEFGKEDLIRCINQTRVKYTITAGAQLNKIRDVLPYTPTIEKIVDIDRNESNAYERIGLETVSLESLENSGGKSILKLAKVSLNKADNNAIVFITTASNGRPKGKFATHRYIIASVKTNLTVLWRLHDERHRHRYVAYLPLTDVNEFLVQLYCFSTGIKLGYSSAVTLMDGSLGLSPKHVPDIRLIKPTFMCAVPAIIDCLRNEILHKLRTNSRFQELLINYLVEYKSLWRSRGYTTPVCNLVLCNKARQLFGGSLEYMFVVGSPVR